MTLIQKRYLSLFGITIVVCLIELTGTVQTRSYGILSDAVHLLGDLAPFGIGFASVVWVLNDHQHDLFGKLIYVLNLTFMAGMVLVIGAECIMRFSHPVNIEPQVFYFALVGLVGNVGQLYFAQGLKEAHRHAGVHTSQVVHLAADVASSVAVLIGATIVALTGWSQADTLSALFATTLIVYAMWHVSQHSPWRHDHAHH